MDVVGNFLFFSPSVQAQRKWTNPLARYFHNSEELYQLLPTVVEHISLDLPAEMRPRKRGQRGGAQIKYTLQYYKPVLLPVIMGNVQSLVTSWQY